MPRGTKFKGKVRLMLTAALATAVPSGLAMSATAAPAAAPFRNIPIRSQAPAGAPNVLLVLTDDVGFAATSAFGGLIPTPALDQLAASGLRYNAFHTTAMCSPTRAALLPGAITTRSRRDRSAMWRWTSRAIPR